MLDICDPLGWFRCVKEYPSIGGTVVSFCLCTEDALGTNLSIEINCKKTALGKLSAICRVYLAEQIVSSLY